MGYFKCADGFAMKGGRCIQVTGKAAKKAKYAVAAEDYQGRPNGMPSSEHKAELRGTRRPDGVEANGAAGLPQMEGRDGSIIHGGSDAGFNRRHGDSKMKKRISSGPKMATVSGGTGHRYGVRGLNKHIVTDPHQGNTPRPRDARGYTKVDAANMRYLKKSIKMSGDGGGMLGAPTDGSTGGGEGQYAGSLYRDGMGGPKAKQGNFLKRRRNKDGYNQDGKKYRNRNKF